MVPIGAVDDVIADLLPHLERGDILIDGGNSYYIDDIRRAKELTSKGHSLCRCRHQRRRLGPRARLLHDDRRRTPKSVKHLDPIFATLAPGRGDIPRTPGREKVSGTSEQGYLHCGPNGAGHFVKMVHNGIEYGVMAAYAEGLAVLKAANVGKKPAAIDAETTPLRDPEHYQYDLNLADIAEVWRRGSVIASWLLDLTATALIQDPALTQICRTGVRLRRRPLDDQGRHRRRRAGACAIRRRFMNDSARAERRTSPTSCFPPCATSSAATSRSRPRSGLADNGAKRRCSKQSRKV